MKSYCLFASEKQTPEHKAVVTPDGKTLWIRVMVTNTDLDEALDMAMDEMLDHETVLNSIPGAFGT